MKKVLKFFWQGNMILLCTFILYTSCRRRQPEPCPVPSDIIGTINVDMRLFVENSNSGQGDCPFPSNAAFISNLQDFVKEKADNPAKRVVEISVSGTCPDDRVWTKFYKKGDFVLSFVSSPNLIRFTLPNLPRSSSNEYTLVPILLSPCVGTSTSCNGKTNYRQKFDLGGNGFTIKNPIAGQTFELKDPGSQLFRILFQSEQVDCQ